MASSEPVWIEVTRGDRVESRHRVDAVVSDSSGNVVEVFGDTSRPTQPRSAAKPIQALPLVLSGAADAFGLTQAELALACASHCSEPGHVDAVRSLLDRVGSGVHELECGAHWPINDEATDAMVIAGIEPGPEHNNCSGKHSGFLTTAHHLDEDPIGYLQAKHPVQQRVTAILEQMCSYEFAGQTPGIDGCGIPVWTMPLANLALGWARLTDSSSTSAEIGVAANRLLDAMTSEPWYVSGTNQTSTLIMEEFGPRVAVKGGAEGVFGGADRTRQLGIALKTDDGSSRGSNIAIDALIRRVIGAPAPEPELLHNVGGTLVGEVRVASF